MTLSSLLDFNISYSFSLTIITKTNNSAINFVKIQV